MSSPLVLSVALDGMAVSQYVDWNFTSIFPFQGAVYAVGPSGLYRLEEDQEDGDNLPWSIATPMCDCGSHEVKRVREVVVSGRKTENVRVSVQYDNGYCPNALPLRGGRFVFGRQGQGRAVMLTLSGEGHCDITSFVMEILSLGKKV